ncbi:MAG: sodium:solute symporter family protein [Verrucomicrobiales bacterium]|nr:sodium:solute symporter family protein [Verrucomicrobiales bacterium]
MDPFVYQYSVGGLVFVVGLYFAGRQGYIGLSGRGFRNLLLMLGGMMFFMVLQGYLQYAPMSELEAVPYTGGERAEKSIGKPIDFGIMGIYIVMILLIGTWFGRRQQGTKDYFFGGQRFSWWMIAFSLVATLVGSYSFVKYSQAAYNYGFASSQSYLNDWALMPLLLFGWLPILYFSRITTVPEYFERRFNRKVRLAATVGVLVYLVSYVGVNLYTMGTVFHHLLGWNVMGSAILIAGISAIYVTFGGQTSVIMTDLFQGVMLLLTGIVLLVLGIHYLGGVEEFLGHLPRGHRLAFNNFNENPTFPSVGIFWQDAMANSAFFYFLNQGILMRYMATKSTREARKAAIAMPLILMPIAAIVVASGGWIGQSFVHAGILPEMDPKKAFYITAEFLSHPGVFGLILAALTAALMSTVDTLITAVSAVVVNDIYKPLVKPNATDKQLLRTARISSIGVTLLGIALVPVFMQFATIYAAHGAMTAAVTPPLVVALILSVFWRRFTAKAALATIVGGLLAIGVSIFIPEIIRLIAHGVPMDENFRDNGEGLFAGAKEYKFMRALFGLIVSGAIGVIVTLFTKPEPKEKQAGLVWGTVKDAIRHYKGSEGSEDDSAETLAMPMKSEVEAPLEGEGKLPTVRLSATVMAQLRAKVGDPVYITDTRWWLGGLQSMHVVVGGQCESDADVIELGPDTHGAVVTAGRHDRPLKVERLY